MPFGIQPIHIVIIIVIGFLLFGANKLPEMGRSLGKTISEFRKGTKEATEGFKEEINKPIQAPVAPAAPVQGSAAPAPTVSSAPAGNFCIQCGAANPVEARFCASCGTKLPGKSS
ncbi:MAG TPA: twin-arginine translocase TatA/TatE family subunit [Anaerolineales bacterium]